jgi:hypothetical protein
MYPLDLIVTLIIDLEILIINNLRENVENEHEKIFDRHNSNHACL